MVNILLIILALSIIVIAINKVHQYYATPEGNIDTVNSRLGRHLPKPHQQPKKTVTVEATVTKKENPLSTQESFALAIDVKPLVGLLLTDPSSRNEIQEVINAYKSGQFVPPTTRLGICNLRAGADAPDNYYSLFAAVDSSLAPHSVGYLRRTGKNRISLRLRMQPKEHQAVVSPAVALPGAAANPQVAQLLANPAVQQLITHLTAAQAQQPANVAQPQPAFAPPPAPPVLPPQAAVPPPIPVPFQLAPMAAPAAAEQAPATTNPPVVAPPPSPFSDDYLGNLMQQAAGAPQPAEEPEIPGAQAFGALPPETTEELPPEEEPENNPEAPTPEVVSEDDAVSESDGTASSEAEEEASEEPDTAEAAPEETTETEEESS